MSKGVITIMFEKGSQWKGELYPLFDKKSDEEVFEKKRPKIEKLLKKIEGILNG
jgi:hypothetical protein